MAASAHRKVLMQCSWGLPFSVCSLLFIGAGVLQLVRDQDTELLGIKNFSRTFGALPDYGVTEVFLLRKGLKRLSAHDQ